MAQLDFPILNPILGCENVVREILSRAMPGHKNCSLQLKILDEVDLGRKETHTIRSINFVSSSTYVHHYHYITYNERHFLSVEGAEIEEDVLINRLASSWTLTVPKGLQVGHQVLPCQRVIGEIRLDGLAILQCSALDHTSANRAQEMVVAGLDGEIRNRHLIRQSLDQTRDSEEPGIDLFVTDCEFEVAAEVHVLPLQFLVCMDKPVRVVVGGVRGDVLAIRTRRGDCSSRKLNAD